MQQKRIDRLAGLRKLGRRVLPRRVLHTIKKLYYPHLLKRFDESRWPLASIAKQLVRPGDVVVDAGANIGYVTLMLARWVGPAGCVHSFEPVPDTSDLLSHNVRALELSNVIVHACGLSDHECDAIMEIPLFDEGGGENLYESRIVPAGETQPALRHVPVHTIPLDSVFDGATMRWPAFVKIDVEGHEAQVLDGMRTILREAKPALLIELSGPAEVRARLFRSLQEMGYTAYAWTGSTLQLRPEPAGDVDCFFLQPSHRDAVAPA